MFICDNIVWGRSFKISNPEREGEGGQGLNKKLHG